MFKISCLVSWFGAGLKFSTLGWTHIFQKQTFGLIGFHMPTASGTIPDTWILRKGWSGYTLCVHPLHTMAGGHVSRPQSIVTTPGLSSPGAGNLPWDRPYHFDMTDPFDKHLQQDHDRGSDY